MRLWIGHSRCLYLYSLKNLRSFSKQATQILLILAFYNEGQGQHCLIRHSFSNIDADMELVIINILLSTAGQIQLHIKSQVNFRKVGIPTLLSTIPASYRFLLCAQQYMFCAR